MLKALTNKLGKLSLLILEPFVDRGIGGRTVNQIRQVYEEATLIEHALAQAQERFSRIHPDRAICKALFVDLSQRDRPELRDALRHFRAHPADEQQFAGLLKQMLEAEFGQIERERIENAIEVYSAILTEELALLDKTFGEGLLLLKTIRALPEEKPTRNPIQKTIEAAGLARQRAAQKTALRPAGRNSAAPRPETAIRAEITLREDFAGLTSEKKEQLIGQTAAILMLEPEELAVSHLRAGSVILALDLDPLTAARLFLLVCHEDGLLNLAQVSAVRFPALGLALNLPGSENANTNLPGMRARLEPAATRLSQLPAAGQPEVMGWSLSLLGNLHSQAMGMLKQAELPPEEYARAAQRLLVMEFTLDLLRLAEDGLDVSPRYTLDAFWTQLDALTTRIATLTEGGDLLYEHVEPTSQVMLRLAQTGQLAGFLRYKLAHAASSLASFRRDEQTLIRAQNEIERGQVGAYLLRAEKTIHFIRDYYQGEQVLSQILSSPETPYEQLKETMASFRQAVDRSASPRIIAQSELGGVIAGLAGGQKLVAGQRNQFQLLEDKAREIRENDLALAQALFGPNGLQEALPGILMDTAPEVAGPGAPLLAEMRKAQPQFAEGFSHSLARSQELQKMKMRADTVRNNHAAALRKLSYECNGLLAQMERLRASLQRELQSAPANADLDDISAAYNTRAHELREQATPLPEGYARMNLLKEELATATRFGGEQVDAALKRRQAFGEHYEALARRLAELRGALESLLRSPGEMPKWVRSQFIRSLGQLDELDRKLKTVYQIGTLGQAEQACDEHGAQLEKQYKDSSDLLEMKTVADEIAEFAEHKEFDPERKRTLETLLEMMRQTGSRENLRLLLGLGQQVMDEHPTPEEFGQTIRALAAHHSGDAEIQDLRARILKDDPDSPLG